MNPQTSLAHTPEDARPVYIAAAAAISHAGIDWRALEQNVRLAKSLAPNEFACCAFAPARQLTGFGEYAAMASGEVRLPDAQGNFSGTDSTSSSNQDFGIDARSRKLMSQPAQLAAMALKLLLEQVNWDSTSYLDTGFYLGVGASGADMQQLHAMLALCIHEQTFSVADFGRASLAACNPLFAFQLMNNFTLCHAAILHGIGGPNSAFYSRGMGTFSALQEAHWQIRSGALEQAISGAADSALHPVTWAQISQAWPELIPAEGAALLALSASADQALAQLGEMYLFRQLQDFTLPQSWQAGSTSSTGNVLLVACASRQQFAAIHSKLHSLGHTRQNIIALGAVMGEALAASAALAWLAGLAYLLETPHLENIWVLSMGLDQALTLVEIRSLG